MHGKDNVKVGVLYCINDMAIWIYHRNSGTYCEGVWVYFSTGMTDMVQGDGQMVNG